MEALDQLVHSVSVEAEELLAGAPGTIGSEVSQENWPTTARCIAAANLIGKKTFREQLWVIALCLSDEATARLFVRQDKLSIREMAEILLWLATCSHDGVYPYSVPLPSV